MRNRISSRTGANNTSTLGNCQHFIRNFSTSRQQIWTDSSYHWNLFHPKPGMWIEALCVDWFGEMMFIHTLRNLATAHIHTYYSCITCIDIMYICIYIYVHMTHVILHIIDDTSQWIQVYFLKNWSYSFFNIFPNLETTCRNITRRWLLNGSGPQN